MAEKGVASVERIGTGGGEGTGSDDSPLLEALQMQARATVRLERLFKVTLGLFVTILAIQILAGSGGSNPGLSLALAESQTAAPEAQPEVPGWPHAAPPLPDPVEEPPTGPVASEAPAETSDPAMALRERDVADETAGPPDSADPVQAATRALEDIARTFRETQGTLVEIERLQRQWLDEVSRLSEVLETRQDASRVDENLGEIVGQLRRLNLHIDIMAASIDSTLGRMGRMAPYGW